MVKWKNEFNNMKDTNESYKVIDKELGRCE